MTQKEKVLEMLQNAGSDGVSNVEFVEAGIQRYGAHLKQLKEEGWNYEKVSIESAGKSKVYLYLLNPTEERWKRLQDQSTERDVELEDESTVDRVFEVLRDGNWHMNSELTTDIGVLRLGPVIMAIENRGYLIVNERVGGKDGSFRYRIIQGL